MNLGRLLSLEVVLEFEVAFPGEEKRSVEDYLYGASRDMVLKASTIFLAFKNHGSIYTTKRFFETFFCAENNVLANEIYKRVRRIEERGTVIQIINPYSSLKLFELVFKKPEEVDIQTQSEFEINLFKAYLVLNSELTAKQKVAMQSTKALGEGGSNMYFPLVFFCSEYPLFDKTNFAIRQVWLVQTIKAMYLFKFLEGNTKTDALFKEFLAHFGCSSWSEYLTALLSLTSSVAENESEQNIDIRIPQDSDFERNCEFIEKLMIQPVDDFDNYDFLSLRGKPVYKIGEGRYRIIFNLFVVEKIFKGMYFVLRELNETLPQESKIRNIRSTYAYEFSEKVLLYNAIESIFTDKSIKLSGSQIVDAGIDGGTDFYVRKGKNILLFETKDFLIAADKKMSFDYEVYEEEFGRILDYEISENGRQKSKAVVQLGNSIVKVLNCEIDLDKNYNYKDVFIYPILVTHDFQYDVSGFNELINSWFQDELQILKGDGFFVDKVRPLTVINIDTLLYFQGVLKEKLFLPKVIDDYHEFKKVPKVKTKIKTRSQLGEYQNWYQGQVLDRLVSFHPFIERVVKRNNLWVGPSIGEEISPELFKEL